MSVTVQDKRAKHIEVLENFCPPGTATLVYDWIVYYRIRFRISKSRNSRFGDYQSPYRSGVHKISVNHDLNRYAFLITFCHEVAHLVQWEKHRDNVAPHGSEWKHEFRILLLNFIGHQVFPPDVEAALDKYIMNPRASSCADHELYRTLKRYDVNPVTHLEELPMGSLFSIGSGKLFKKGAKQRTRFLCQCLDDKRMYYVSGIAEVKVITQALFAE
jgi:SprT protein